MRLCVFNGLEVFIGGTFANRQVLRRGLRFATGLVCLYVFDGIEVARLGGVREAVRVDAGGAGLRQRGVGLRRWLEVVEGIDDFA